MISRKLSEVLSVPPIRGRIVLPAFRKDVFRAGPAHTWADCSNQSLPSALSGLSRPYVGGLFPVSESVSIYVPVPPIRGRIILYDDDGYDEDGCPAHTWADCSDRLSKKDLGALSRPYAGGLFCSAFDFADGLTAFCFLCVVTELSAWKTAYKKLPVFRRVSLLSAGSSGSAEGFLCFAKIAHPDTP